MTSIIRLTPVSGAMGEYFCSCYLLEIDDFRFLLDPGWDELFIDQRGSGDSCTSGLVEKIADKIDGVLLSHSDTSHLGSLPYLVRRCGLKCPVYATVPIWKMGQMFMYDSYLNNHNTREFKLFNLDDVDAAFDRIVQVQFGQVVALKGKGHGITVTALPAGHTLGGTVWKISKVGEEDIYYAIDHNNKKERHLNGCEMMEKLAGESPPGVLITNAINALYVQEKRRKRDELLMSVLSRTLRMGGNVLIASDTAGRSLELALMLDQMWRMKDSGLSAYSLVFLNNVAFNVLEFAKGQIEWMGEKLQKSYESTRVNPFQLRNVKVCHTLAEMASIPSPKVVLTSSSDLEGGFSRDLFLQWCQDPHSSVVLTNRTSPGTLARQLMQDHSPGRCITLEVRQKVRLEGRELEEYYEVKRRKQQEHSSVDSDSEDEDVVVVASRSSGSQRVNGSATLPSSASGVFINGQNNNVNGKENSGSQMFPFMDSQSRKRKFDEYGEIVEIQDFKEHAKRRGRHKEWKNKKQVHHQPPQSPDNEANETDEPPVKYLCMKQTVVVNCMVHFIDFEGRSDVEAVLKMLQEMQPHKLVIVRGTPEATEALGTLCQSLLPNSKIFKPAVGDVVDLTTGNQLLQVTLTDSLMSNLRFQKVRGMELAWVDGRLASSANDVKRKKTDTLGRSSLFDCPLLTPVTVTASSTTGPTSPKKALHVNKLRLTEFKQILGKNGIQSEFAGGGGVLRVRCSNGVVYIQKDSKSKELVLECDGFTEEYYTIRSLLYEQFAIL